MFSRRMGLGLCVLLLSLLPVCGNGCQKKGSGTTPPSASASSEGTAAKKTNPELIQRAKDGDLDIDTVNRLTADGDVDGQDEQGMTALHWAAKNGHLGTTEALVKAGANPNIVDKAGKTAVQYALEGGHEGTAGVIRAAMGGASPSTPPETTSAPGKQGPNPSLKYPDLPSFEKAIGQPGCLLTSEHVHMFAPKVREAEANIVFPYLVRAYDELYAIVGVHTEFIIVVYCFTKGHADAFGGTGNCALYYDDENLDLTQQDEWNQCKVPHVCGFIEEMAHNFVGATKAQFGWEMMGWSIGSMASDKVAGNPIFANALNATRQGQTETFQRYTQMGHVFPADLPPNQVDRIHAYILWQCELAYGPTFWPDFFREVRKEYPRLRDAVNQSGQDAIRNARYQITIDCFDRLQGLNFKSLLQENGISLTTDVKSLHPTEPGWNRKLE